MNDKIWDATENGTITYAWTPQRDIDAYELALCQPVFSTRIDSGSKGHSVDKLPERAKRHFTKVG